MRKGVSTAGALNVKGGGNRIGRTADFKEGHCQKISEKRRGKMRKCLVTLSEGPSRKRRNPADYGKSVIEDQLKKSIGWEGGGGGGGGNSTIPRKGLMEEEFQDQLTLTGSFGFKNK